VIVLRGSRLFGSAVAALVLAGAGAIPAQAASPRDTSGDPTLTLTAASTGTTLYGGVGAGLIVAAPYVVSGGSGQVTWTDSGLPSGLAASPTTGVIAGTPTLPGEYDVTVTVADADGQSQSGPITYLIDPVGLTAHSGLFPYVVAIAKDPVNSVPVIATGDTEGLEWSATGLPPGLQLDPDIGTLTGKPTAVGAFTARISATNVVGDTAYLSVLMEVVVGYTCNYQQAGRVGQRLTINCGVFWSPNPNQGGRWFGLPGHLSYSGSGLPKGLHIDASTGVISGKPKKAGTSFVTVTVTARPDGVLVTGPAKWKSVVRCGIAR
jgi:hypothetical protein